MVLEQHDRPRGAGTIPNVCFTTERRHLSYKDWQHILQLNARPAPSCGHLCRASCSEQPGNHWQNASQFPRRPGRPNSSQPARPDLANECPGARPSRTVPPTPTPPRKSQGPGPTRPTRPVVVSCCFSLFCRHLSWFGLLEPRIHHLSFWGGKWPFRPPQTLFLYKGTRSEKYYEIGEKKKTKGQMIPCSRMYWGEVQWRHEMKLVSGGVRV